MNMEPLSRGLQGIEATLKVAIEEQIKKQATSLNTEPLIQAQLESTVAFVAKLDDVKATLGQVAALLQQQIKLTSDQHVLRATEAAELKKFALLGAQASARAQNSALKSESFPLGMLVNRVGDLPLDIWPAYLTFYQIMLIAEGRDENAPWVKNLLNFYGLGCPADGRKAAQLLGAFLAGKKTS